MPQVSIILAADSQRRFAITQIVKAPIGYIVKIGEPTRTDLQNRLLHPLLHQIKDAQPERFKTIEEMKLVFLDALQGEMRFLEGLDGGYFPVGRKTSTLSKSQFSDLLELVYRYAATKGITLKDRRQSA